MPAKPKLRLVKPAIQKRAVGPLRRPNSEFRSREHLTETEVEKLIKAAEGNRHGHRDATMILVAYRHANIDAAAAIDNLDAAAKYLQDIAGITTGDIAGI